MTVREFLVDGARQRSGKRRNNFYDIHSGFSTNIYYMVNSFRIEFYYSTTRFDKTMCKRPTHCISHDNRILDNILSWAIDSDCIAGQSALCTKPLSNNISTTEAVRRPVRRGGGLLRCR